MRIKNYENVLIVLLLNFLIIFSASAQNRTDADGKKQGKWIRYKNSAKFYEGQFINDIPVGEFKYFYPNGHLKIRTVFSKGARLNRTKVFFDSYNEKIQAEGNYYDKKKDSTWNYYNDAGHLIAVENYKKGIREGDFKVFNHLGQLNLRNYYKNDTLHGEAMEYLETGAEFRLITYAHGKREGAFKLFYPNGNILLEGKYLQDIRDSIWTTYTETGAIEFLDYYVNGLLQKRTDKVGNKLDLKKEEEMVPLNVDPSVFDPSAIKR
jgi:antitoxin component YwqK of YwqJK toxin-antitoxin module